MGDFVQILPDGRLFISDETVQNDTTVRLVKILTKLPNYWRRDMWLAGWISPVEEK